MIRLIASDIDGTLLQGGAAEISQEIFGHIQRLEKKGILFCPASGRQYASLRKLFAPVADTVPFLCENGAVVFGPGNPGEVLSKTIMDRELSLSLCREIVSLPDIEVLISGVNSCYLCPKGPGLEEQIRWFLGNCTAVVPSPEDVPEDIIKVSAYCPHGLLEKIRQILFPKWEQHFRAAIAGEEWLDFTLADKGVGLRSLCEALDIDMADVMAFGDNFNDLPMLKLAGHPYLMENSAPELKALIPSHCRTVASILQTL